MTLNICRGCLKVEDDVKFMSVFEEGGKIAKNIFDLTRLVISDFNNQTTACICPDCLDELDQACFFRARLIRNHKRFLEMYENDANYKGNKFLAKKNNKKRKISREECSEDYEKNLDRNELASQIIIEEVEDENGKKFYQSRRMSENEMKKLKLDEEAKKKAENLRNNKKSQNDSNNFQKIIEIPQDDIEIKEEVIEPEIHQEISKKTQKESTDTPVTSSGLKITQITSQVSLTTFEDPKEISGPPQGSEKSFEAYAAPKKVMRVPEYIYKSSPNPSENLLIKTRTPQYIIDDTDKLKSKQKVYGGSKSGGGITQHPENSQSIINNNQCSLGTSKNTSGANSFFIITEIKSEVAEDFTSLEEIKVEDDLMQVERDLTQVESNLSVVKEEKVQDEKSEGLQMRTRSKTNKNEVVQNESSALTKTNTDYSKFTRSLSNFAKKSTTTRSSTVSKTSTGLGQGSSGSDQVSSESDQGLSRKSKDLSKPTQGQKSSDLRIMSSDLSQMSSSLSELPSILEVSSICGENQTLLAQNFSKLDDQYAETTQALTSSIKIIPGTSKKYSSLPKTSNDIQGTSSTLNEVYKNEDPEYSMFQESYQIIDDKMQENFVNEQESFQNSNPARKLTTRKQRFAANDEIQTEITLSEDHLTLEQNQSKNLLISPEFNTSDYDIEFTQGQAPLFDTEEQMLLNEHKTLESSDIKPILLGQEISSRDSKNLQEKILSTHAIKAKSKWRHAELKRRLEEQTESSDSDINEIDLANEDEFSDDDVDPVTGKFNCKFCGKYFNKRCHLNQHKKTHMENKFRCGVCGKKYEDKAVLMKHAVKHIEDKPWKCGYCIKAFCHKADMKRHEMTHLSNKPFKCDICGHGFVRHDHLLKHQKTHVRKAHVNYLP